MKIGNPGCDIQQEYMVTVDVAEPSVNFMETLFEVSNAVFTECDAYRAQRFESGEDITDIPLSKIVEEVQYASHLPPETIEEINIANLERWRVIIENGFDGREMETYLRDSHRGLLEEVLWFTPDDVEATDQFVHVSLPGHPLKLSFKTEENVSGYIDSASHIRFWRDKYELESTHNGTLEEMECYIILESDEKWMFTSPEPISSEEETTIHDLNTLSAIEKPAVETSAELFCDILQRGYFSTREQVQLFSLAAGDTDTILIDYWSSFAEVIDGIVEAADWHLISIPQSKQAIITTNTEKAEELRYIPDSFPEVQSLTTDDKRTILSLLEYPEQAITQIISTKDYYATLDGERELLSLYQSGYINYEEVIQYFLATYPSDSTTENVEQTIQRGKERADSLREFEQEHNFETPYCSQLLTHIEENPQYLSEEYF